MGNEMVIVRNPADLELWQERFSECRRSGMTVAAWCEMSIPFWKTTETGEVDHLGEKVGPDCEIRRQCMYTYEEKKKAVDLFIKYDLSPAAVIHELGYPSKNRLYQWYQEYISTGVCGKVDMQKTANKMSERGSGGCRIFTPGNADCGGTPGIVLLS